MTSTRSDWAKAPVVHGTFGHGEVIDVRRGGAELLVQFKAVKSWIPTQDLRRLDGKTLQAKPGKPKVTQGRQKQDGSGVRKSRQIIEALRLGIVPQHCIQDFTFGREEETAAFDRELKCLNQDGHGLLIVEGEYGDGKSHFLDFSAERALEAGCAVMRADLDTVEVPPSKPKRVYQALMSSFRFREDSGNDGDIVSFMTTVGREVKETGHDFIDPLLRAIRRLPPDSDDMALVWQWFRGEDVPRWYISGYSGLPIWLPSMLEYMTSADLYCNLLSGLGHLVRQTNRPGILLIIDEAETVTRFWDGYREARARNFLGALLRLASNDRSLLRLFQSDLQHSGMRAYRFMFAEPSGLFLLMALTPSWSVDEFFNSVLKNGADQQRLLLSEIDGSDRTELLTATVQHYSAAYPGFRWPTRIPLDHVAHAVADVRDVRRVVRRFLGALDNVRHYPDGDPLEIFRLA